MKRALPVLVLTVAGLVPLWRYEPSTATTSSSSASSSSSAGEVTETTPTPTPTSSSSSSSSSSASTVVRGSTVDTAKGAVQVEVTFEGDRIGSVRTLQQPDHPQTTAAVPKLIAETLEAQSADIDTVSGATITSDGYRESLQAALDAKGA